VKERAPQQPWTDDDKATLVRMHGQGLDMVDIAAFLGRSKGTCHTMLSRIRRGRVVGKTTTRTRRDWTDADIAEMNRLREVEHATWSEIDTRLGRPAGSSCGRYHGARHSNVPPGGMVLRPEVIAALLDRDARKKLEHPTLTAAFFGDPLPGRSALDERRLKEAGQ